MAIGQTLGDGKMMAYWYEVVVFICVVWFGLSILVIIRLWLDGFVEKITKRDRYTVVVASEFGTYTFTGAKVDFVPAEHRDQDTLNRHWNAWTHPYSTDDNIVSMDRVVGTIHDFDDVWSQDRALWFGDLFDEHGQPIKERMYHIPECPHCGAKLKDYNYSRCPTCDKELPVPVGEPNSPERKAWIEEQKEWYERNTTDVRKAIGLTNDPAAHKPGPWPPPKKPERRARIEPKPIDNIMRYRDGYGTHYECFHCGGKLKDSNDSRCPMCDGELVGE